MLITRASQDGDVTVVTLDGLLEYQETAELRKSFRTWVSWKPRLLILDMSGIRNTDSAALGLMVAAKHSMAGHGGLLVLCGATPRVTKVLVSTCLMDYFTVVDTLEQAKAL